MLGLAELTRELGPLFQRDRWAELQFDMAIIHFGRYIEAKLEEVDQKGRYKYNLRQLLWDEDDTKSAIKDPKRAGIKGFFGRYVSRKQRQESTSKAGD